MTALQISRCLSRFLGQTQNQIVINDCDIRDLRGPSFFRFFMHNWPNLNWKQWRRARTWIQNLRPLEICADEAVTHGISSKGPCVMSSSPDVHEAISLIKPDASG